MNKSLRIKIVEVFGSQSIFARKIGRSDAFVSRVIHEYDNPTDAEKKRWAKKLKCNVTEIFN